MSRWVVALLLVTAGLGAGLAYGWLVAPVQYVDTTPSSLRADFRADYVLMVAERFHADHDAEGATRSLAIFGGQSASEACLEAIAFARVAPYAGQDLLLLEELNRALQQLAPLPPPQP